MNMAICGPNCQLDRTHKQQFHSTIYMLQMTMLVQQHMYRIALVVISGPIKLPDAGIPCFLHVIRHLHL